MQVEVTSINKFDSYVQGVGKKLEQEKAQLNDRLRKLSQMTVLEDAPTAQNVLKAREGLLLLDPNLDNSIRVIDFFLAHDAMDAEQVQMALDSITKNDYFKKRVVLESKGEDQVHRVEAELEKVGAVLRREQYDFDYFLTLLDQSGLEEEDQLAVLTKEAWDSCVKANHKKKTSPESSKTKTVEPVVQAVEPKKVEVEPITVMESQEVPAPVIVEVPHEEVVPTEEPKQDLFAPLRERYTALSKEINDYLSQYSYLYQGKSEKEIELAKNLAACEKEMKMTDDTGEIDTSSFSYVEERLMVQLLELSMYKEELQTVFANETQNQDVYEEASLYLDETEGLLHEVKDSVDEYNASKQEEAHPTASKIFFLLDKNSPCFDLTHFNASEKKRIQLLMDRLERGIEDPEMSNRHTKVQKKLKTDYDMYVVRSSNMACCYTKAGNDSLVILTFAPAGEIFDQAIYISKRYDREINSLVTKIKEKDATTLSQAPIIREEMDKALLPKGGIEL